MRRRGAKQRRGVWRATALAAAFAVAALIAPAAPAEPTPLASLGGGAVGVEARPVATLTNQDRAAAVAIEDAARVRVVPAAPLAHCERVTTARTAVTMGPSRDGARCCVAPPALRRRFGWRDPGHQRVGGARGDEPGMSYGSVQKQPHHLTGGSAALGTPLKA